jgi:DNA-binding NtrC family response regulator
MDHDAATARRVRELLGATWDIECRTSSAAAMEAVIRRPFDVLLADLGPEGLGLCERALGAAPDLRVIVMTAAATVELAVAAIRAGAYDFICKPIDWTVLGLALDRAQRHRRLELEVVRLRRALDITERFDELLGRSPPMLRLFRLLDQVACSDATVLIRGETGTGKELVARAIHRRSRRRAGPFVAINCAAMPEALLESELFGHARGAFTGAAQRHVGLLERAEGGTVLLDEVGDMSLTLQSKLLRALQERHVRPVGGAADVPFDAHVLSATHRDLESATADGRFRQDLLFRLDVIGVAVPPLRERGDDVLLLAQHFVERFAAAAGKTVTGLTSAVAERLLAWPWPGNVRELQNCMERAVALTRTGSLVPEDLSDGLRTFRPTQFVLPGDDPAQLVPLEEVERRYIARVLEACQGNKTLAARTLRVDRKTLYRKLAHHGLDAVP